MFACLRTGARLIPLEGFGESRECGFGGVSTFHYLRDGRDVIISHCRPLEVRWLACLATPSLSG